VVGRRACSALVEIVIMATISRRDVVLLLLGVSSRREATEGIGGITRLQKLLFLLEREQNFRPTGDGFEFSAYKAGPYSSRLYDDLEFLENLGLIETEVSGEVTEPEAAEVDLLSFEELMGDEADTSSGSPSDGFGATDAYEERRFTLSEAGKQKIATMVKSGEYDPVVNGIKKVKSKYGQYSLSDLLYYVYTKYPEMTTESEIKDKVLRRRSRA